MYRYIVCFTDEAGALRAVRASEPARAATLFIHLNKSLGLDLAEVLALKMSGSETFDFEGDLYQAATAGVPEGRGLMVFISDEPVRAQVFEAVLNQLNLGVEIFNAHGRLFFLNETCQRLESLIKENVLGKHHQDIYTVDPEYSTTLTTLRTRRPVRDRCDSFANRFGDQLISINNGRPIFLEDRFFGALGLVMDLELLASFTAQREILTSFIKQLPNRAPGTRSQIKDRHYLFSDLIGESESLKAAVAVARKVAAGDFSVLLLGETGTGKEMFAQSIHSASPRRERNFVAINCAAIPATILESVLFGTVKGAFTGSGNQKGLLDEADGGTLFLDEINCLDIQLQPKLLRVLQEKKFRRVGGLRDQSVDFRVVAAMNESPDEALAHQRLRQDLYYRLNTVTIDIPPLRDRPADIQALVDHYLGKHARPGRPRRLAPPAATLLQEYDWPGNVRELFHTLDYALALAEEGAELDRPHFPDRLSRRPAIPAATERPNFLHRSLRERLEAHEKHLLETTLRECGQNISRAAKALKLSRQALQHRLRKCGLSSGPEA